MARKILGPTNISRHQLYLPNEDVLREELLAERERLEQTRRQAALNKDEGRDA